MKVREIETGRTIKIISYQNVDKNYRQKLLRMGLMKGETFSIVRKAPMGDPIEIHIKGFNLTLRKKEADALVVEVVK